MIAVKHAIKLLRRICVDVLSYGEEAVLETERLSVTSELSLKSMESCVVGGARPAYLCDLPCLDSVETLA